MATGKIKTVTSDTTGIITRDDNGSDINYDDSTLPSQGIVLKAQDPVSFDIVQVGPVQKATNIKLLLTEPAPPNDEGEVITGTVNGNVDVPAGVTKTFKGATVNGNVRVRGGKVIGKDNTQRTVFNGTINATQNSHVVLYKCDMKKTVAITNSQKFDAYYKNDFTSTVVANNNGTVVLKESKVDGDVIANNNTTSVTVQNNTITGDLVLNNNTGCNQSGNNVGGSNSGCA